MSENLPVIKYDGRKFVGIQKPCCADVVDASIPLPELLINLYADADVQNSCDCLAVLQHVLMLEAGFLPVDVPEEECYTEMPPYFYNATYKIFYYHKDCPGVRCLMSCVPIRALLVSHGIILDRNAHNKIFLTLPIKPYIKDSEGYGDPASVYCYMSRLAKCFKRDFSFPLLQAMCRVAELEPVIGLTNIPVDVKYQILSFLPIKDLVTMSAVNKEFNEIANSNFLWKPIYLRNFPNEVPSNGKEKLNWKKAYVSAHETNLHRNYLVDDLMAHIRNSYMELARSQIRSLLMPDSDFHPYYPAVLPDVQQAFMDFVMQYCQPDQANAQDYAT